MNIAYLNGSACDDLHVVSLYNPTFLYGINCFEGIRAYWDPQNERMNWLDLEPHMSRLYASAERIGLSPPVTQEDLESELRQILAVHDIREDIYVRVTVFIGGDGSWRTSDDVHYAVSVRSHPSRLAAERPVRLGISTYRRIPTDVMPPQVKAGANYLNSRYAYRDAVARGFDDALFLTTAGHIAEATGSAIFFVAGEGLVTPSLECDLLESITRRRVINLARELGIEVQEACLKPSTAATYDAAFLVGTSIEMKPVSAIESTEYPGGNPVYRRVKKAFVDWIDRGAH